MWSDSPYPSFVTFVAGSCRWWQILLVHELTKLLIRQRRRSVLQATSGGSSSLILAI